MRKEKKKEKRVTVGTDEFCLDCMEWREYDEEGKCKVCGKLIKKPDRPTQRTKYDEYELDNEFEEIEEQGDDGY